MADPALKLPPVEELAAEDAAQQTTRLIIIQGGKSAATAAETTAAAETTGEGLLAGVSAAGLAIAAGLIVLLWPSEIAPEPTMGPPPNPALNPLPAPNPASLTQSCPAAPQPSGP